MGGYGSMLGGMDDATLDSQRLLSLGVEGVLTRADTRESDASWRDIATLITGGYLVRLVDGAVTSRERWEACSTPEQQHRLRAAALSRVLRSDVAISHTSAATVHGLPLLTRPGDRIHVSRLGPGRGRTRRSYTLHRAYPGTNGWLQPASDPLVVTPAVAALGVADLHGFVAGVVALDGALHAKMATIQECHALLATMLRRPGVRVLTRVVDAADGLSESPLESQARLVVQGLGFRVTLQVVLRTEGGEFVARVDMLIEELGVVIEVDGRIKYVNPDGTGSVETVLSEKHRESAIRDLGYGLVRLDHPDLSLPERIRARILAAAEQAAPSRRRRTA